MVAAFEKASGRKVLSANTVKHSIVQLLVPYHYAYVVPLLSPYYKNRKESYIQIKTEPSEPRQGDLPELYCDPALALKELNWKSEYGIDEVFMQHNELKMHFVYQMCRDTWNFIQSMLQYKIQKEAHKSFRKSRRLHQQMIRTTQVLMAFSSFCHRYQS